MSYNSLHHKSEYTNGTTNDRGILRSRRHFLGLLTGALVLGPAFLEAACKDQNQVPSPTEQMNRKIEGALTGLGRDIMDQAKKLPFPLSWERRDPVGLPTISVFKDAPSHIPGHPKGGYICNMRSNEAGKNGQFDLASLERFEIAAGYVTELLEPTRYISFELSGDGISYTWDITIKSIDNKLEGTFSTSQLANKANRLDLGVVEKIMDYTGALVQGLDSSELIDALPYPPINLNDDNSD